MAARQSAVCLAGARAVPRASVLSVVSSYRCLLSRHIHDKLATRDTFRGVHGNGETYEGGSR